MTRAVPLAYGAGVGADGLESAFGLAPRAATAAAVVGVLALLALAGVVAARVGFAGSEPADLTCQRALDAFWVGASVYLGTFVTGHNFDYRLAVLVFTVPQLLLWARSSTVIMPYARFALAAVVGTLWLSTSTPVVPGLSDTWIEAQRRFPFDELLNWFLFVYLAAALIVTAPPWLRRLFARPARRAAATAQRA